MPIIPISGSAAPRGALIPLGRGVITTNTNGITFLNIPQGYQDLRIVCSWKSLTTAFTADGFWLGSSNVTLGNYSSTYAKADGSTVSSVRQSGYYGAYMGDIASSVTPSSMFSSATVDILNYSNTANFKTALCRIANDNNGTGQTWLSVSLLRTTSALTDVTVFNYNAGMNAAIGSTATLYGVRSVNQ